ncbi:MAG TPA: SPOR domain-containing protein [Thiobacillus sp.]|jgi:cell division protein FtsN|nr:SPOR domain-containing protein [Thiobacillus sp.]
MVKPSPRKKDRSGGNSIFTGVLIGLIVGAILAVGVALWITGNNLFKPTAPTPRPAAPAAGVPEPAPSFDFYKVLPGDAQGELPPSTAPAAPATRYFLQAGAFQNADDADNLKAQLAMLGVEAVIQTGEVAGKGVFHRVRVGPFSTMDEVDRTRSLLTQNDIPATLVKEILTPQESP